MISFDIPGVAQAKERPRLGKNGNTYTPRKTSSFEQTVAAYALQARMLARRSKPFAEDVSVHIEFRQMTRGRADIDNLCKAILDGMNKVIFDDDKRVIEISGVFKLGHPLQYVHVEIERCASDSTLGVREGSKS